MPALRRPSAAALVFAWCGAALFALSLGFFLYSYLVRFGRPSHDPAARAIVVDVLLFTVFALHHSVLARTTVKARVRALVPLTLERSLYTWVASALFLVVCGGWQPVPGELWRLRGVGAWIFFGAQAVAVLVTVLVSARLDVLDLAGVRQLIRSDANGREHVPLESDGAYGVVRHPLYFAWFMFVFCTPYMTMTRLVFAVVSCVYLAVAIPFEERGLIEHFGDEYRRYQKAVRWRMLPGVY
jgi:protein-S-isoprenylcysteine O-methyltransferase Ste14